MKKIFSTILLSILFTTMLIPIKAYSKDTSIQMPKTGVDLKLNEEKLWIDHVSWTRNYISSDLSSLPDKDDVLARLLKNQDDIGASIKPYYGDEAGNNLTKLLKEHISIGGQVIDAAKNSNKDDLDKYNKLWYKNADDIADFLSKANPNFKNNELKDMLHKHLEFVTNQVIARLEKDWKKDIELYDKGEDHMIKLADMLSDGIIKQFPDKFK